MQRRAHILRHSFKKVTSKQRATASVRCSCDDIVVFDTQSLFRKVPYNIVHKTEKTHCWGAGRRRLLQFENL